MSLFHRTPKNGDRPDPTTGDVAHDIVMSRLQPTNDVRLSLVDVDGKVLASIDLTHSDARAARDALSQVLRVLGQGGR